MEETIITTTGWNEYMVNDRLYPMLPDIASPYAGAIDAALWQSVNQTLLAAMRFPGPAQGQRAGLAG